MSTSLEDYAIIGDCETAALVSRHGSIDWLCWPRFDSAACFAALLGTADHGRWVIEAVAPEARYARRYRGDTLILETQIETTDGTVTLIVVAAPTTSLPEQIGGIRNWDYRYCWVRDATLTLLALMNAGYFEEARAWRDWLLRAAAGAPAQMQIMYGVAGERRLIEYELRGLPGHEASSPVRVGNAASDQLQLDVYGEVMDALYQARRGGLTPRESDWSFQRTLLEHVETLDRA